MCFDTFFVVDPGEKPFISPGILVNVLMNYLPSFLIALYFLDESLLSSIPLLYAFGQGFRIAQILHLPSIVSTILISTYLI